MLSAQIAVKGPVELDRAITLAAKRHRMDRPAFIRAALARAVEFGLFNNQPSNNNDGNRGIDETQLDSE